MIIGAEFSYEGSFTTATDYERKELTIRASIYGYTIQRVLDFREIPAFIEYLENNDKFQLNNTIYVAPTERWKQFFIDGLKSAMNQEESE